METVALVAPVTALEFLQNAFLLKGEGPVLTVYRLQPHPKVCVSQSVLQHYRIHGVRPRALTTTEPTFCDLAVFGGKAVRLLRLHVEDGEEYSHLEVLGPLMELQDWALDVRWLSGDSQSVLVVALAHNSALLLDGVTGNALAQHSCLEGCLLYSALLLVHESWVDTVIVGGTVFNQLVLWKPGGGKDKSSNPKSKAPIERRLLGHTGVIFRISYLQEKGYLASASDDRSVRIWGVGALGGPEGKCGDLNPVCLRVLYGHQARVFSVRLSSGNVFSAGEDGACLVWDWAEGGKVVRMLKGHRAGGVRALAVSEGDEARWVATGGADGGVRLWKVEGNEKKQSIEEEAVAEKLTDLKFPGQGLPKAVCIAGEEDENTSWSRCKFVVCTDKGIVYQYSAGKWEVVWHGTPEFQSYCVMETVTISVKESTTTADLCAVGNLSGCLQVFPVSHSPSGIPLTCGSGKIHTLIWHKGKECAYLLASGAEGLVYRWRVETKLNESYSLTLSITALPSFFLPPCAKRWLTAAVRLQSRSQEVLWVCGDRRGSLLLFQERETSKQRKGDDEETNEESLTDSKQSDYEEGRAEGNGGGGDGNSRMMENEESKEMCDRLLHPLSCLFGVHGKQGVTSVFEYQGLFYSTGRDGCVRVFRVHSSPPENLEESRHNNTAERSEENEERLRLEVLRVQRACKGMEWLERILILEPEKTEEEEEEEEGTEECEEMYNKEHNLKEEGREARFVIVGFHAVHFVVWDPVRQERLLAVPCGGGHRSWSLWPSHKGIWPGYGALVFIKQGAVLASQPPGEAVGCNGKAGRTGGMGLKEGVHGRGIGCVCRLGRIGEFGNGNQTRNNENEGGEVARHWELVVTGGEDTSLTVLAVHPASGNIKVLSVITDHISSVRTVTAITRAEGGSGNPSKFLSALLVSAGGRAQIQCYRLLFVWDRQRLAPSCQVIQVASHRLDKEWERRRNRHKMVKMDPETRYMSAAVVDEEVNRVLVALACSDGAVRLFSVNEGKGKIDLLWETFYHQRCVLSVATCSLEDDKGNRCKLLFTAATDGKITVWNLSDSSSFSTDYSSNATTAPIPCLDVPAHQSGINSLAVWAVKQGQQQGSCLVTVASGGDDGQLTVSIIRVQHPEDGKIGSHKGFSQISESQPFLQTQLQCPNRLQIQLHSQCHIPLAHAAPLTALKLMRPGLLVSTSSDQRVCLWKVCSNSISHTGALCSHVADAAGLAVWEGEEGNQKVKIGFESVQESVGKLKRDKETADETSSKAPVEVESETGDPVSKTAGEKEEETTTNPRNQTENDCVGKMRSAVSPETGLKEEREGKKAGWVLVCGQGFQLLRVRDMDKEEEGKK
ncbi:LOW QUALITY PROTEIN: tRNA (34-2'-O)-methyltransferase regulator WDR6 [Archocentrus centrarchus]|uniref:LOW QUALITY PROTEIN: tRNA (34-2'-O)-methyltransferase regulator WDR6 n=1 Tax=Archocentrus centrarchus TaxID=63155 RepID=UPI0011E9B5B8|nr:LOW QUALITY PROTEIN: WD repeat-containing protein 6 [Archocentrus centrarchus]